MTEKEMKSLQRGDVIRHKSSGSKCYVVTQNLGNHVVAVDSVDMTNAIEWEIVKISARRES